MVYWVPRLYEQYRLAKYFILTVWLRRYGAINAAAMDKRIAEVKAA
jgi:hypothetical protein